MCANHCTMRHFHEVFYANSTVFNTYPVTQRWLLISDKAISVGHPCLNILIYIYFLLSLFRSLKSKGEPPRSGTSNSSSSHESPMFLLQKFTRAIANLRDLLRRYVPSNLAPRGKTGSESSQSERATRLTRKVLHSTYKLKIQDATHQAVFEKSDEWSSKLEKTTHFFDQQEPVQEDEDLCLCYML